MQKDVVLVCVPCPVEKLCQVLISAKIKMAVNMAAIMSITGQVLCFRSNMWEIKLNSLKQNNFGKNIQFSFKETLCTFIPDCSFIKFPMSDPYGPRIIIISIPMKSLSKIHIENGIVCLLSCLFKKL